MPAPVPRSIPQSRRPDPAWGVFETMLVLDGRPVELDAHLARLSASVAELFPDHPPPPLDVPVERGPYGPLGMSRVAALRVTVAPDGDRLGVRFQRRQLPHGDSVSLSAGKSPTAAVALRSFTLPGGLGPHKWADRSLLDEAQEGLPTDALPLILEDDGSVLEAARANVFVVRAGRLTTPPTDGRILPGVTRMRVLEIAAALGIDTREAALDRDALLAAEEVFLSGSVRGIERVGALDGAALGDGGRVTGRIAAALLRAWTGAKAMPRVG